jgi:hypothetical protein
MLSQGVRARFSERFRVGKISGGIGPSEIIKEKHREFVPWKFKPASQVCVQVNSLHEGNLGLSHRSRQRWTDG